MATVVIDQNYEYIWQVSDDVLKKVLNDVLRHIDKRLAIYDLLYVASSHGKLEFFLLGQEQKTLFEQLVQRFYDESAAEGQKTSLDKADLPKVKQLLDFIAFAKKL